MTDTYLSILLVSAIGQFGWLLNNLLQSIKTDIHKIGETITSLALDLKDARKEFEVKVTDQGLSIRAEISDLSRRMAIVEGRCQSEHGEHMRRADDGHVHRISRS